MADELAFDYVVRGDDRVVKSAERIGKVSAESALRVEAANLRLEKATIAADKATVRFGRDSLEARSASLAMAQAQQKLDKSMTATAVTADKTGSKLERFGGVMEGLAATGGLAAGAALSASFANAIDFEAANAKLEAQLGLSAKDSEKFGAIAGDLYADAYGDSIATVNQAIKEVQQQGLIDPQSTNAAIQSVTGKVLSLADAFDQDLAGTARAAGQLIRTGLAKDADEALDIITVGLQKIPGAGDDLLDTLNEYSTQFRSLGLTGPQAVSFIAAAMQGGARDTDVAADALKEFNLRARDINNTGAQGALTELGFSAKDTARAIAGGGDSAAAATKEILTRLREVQDPAQRSALAVALLGTQAEDLQDALFAVDPAKLTTGLGDIEGAAARVDAALGKTSAATLTSFKRSVEQNFTGAAASVIEFGSANSSIVGPLTGAAAAATGLVVAVNLGKRAVDAARRAYDTASDAVSSLGSAAGKAKGNVAAVGKASAAVAGFVVAMEALAAIAPRVEDSAAGVGEMALALKQLGSADAQNIAGLGKNFGDLGQQLEGLANPNLMQRVDDFTGSLFNIVSFGAVGSSKGGDARRLFLADLETLDRSLANLVSSGQTAQAAALFQELNDKAVAGGAGVDQLAKHLPQYTDAVAQAGASSGEAVTPVKDLARGLGDQSTAAQLAGEQLDALVKSTSAYTDAALNARSAARDYEAAIDDASQAAKDNGRTLDIGTEAGRANAEALDAIASAGVALAQQMVANGASEAQFQGQLQKTRTALIAAGTRMGLTKDAARRYADQVLAIPAARTTSIRLNGVGPANAAIKAFRDNVNRIPGHKTVFVDVVGGNSPARGPSFASARGGPIIGPGTGTSDSIPGFLSNGEHVWTAAEVKAAGGHGAVEALRQAVLTGRPTADSGSRALPSGRLSSPARVVLEVSSGGSRLDDVLVEVIRRAVRVRGGGDVQVALGR